MKPVLKRNLLTVVGILVFVLCLPINAFAERIAIVSDTHVSPGNTNDKQLRIAVDEINNGDASLVIVSGDITNEGSDEELRNVKSILDQITKPTFIIPGNHENNWSQSAGKTFIDLWNADRFVTETDSLIIVGVNCGPYMKMGDGHIKQEDLIWLDTTLAERTASTGKRVLSICHYPINPDLDNYADYVALLQRYPVVTHICGHYHSFKHYNTGGIQASAPVSADPTVTTTIRRRIPKVECDWKGVTCGVPGGTMYILPIGFIRDSMGVIPNPEEWFKFVWYTKAAGAASFTRAAIGIQPKVPFADGMMLELRVEDKGPQVLVVDDDDTNVFITLDDDTPLYQRMYEETY